MGPALLIPMLIAQVAVSTGVTPGVMRQWSLMNREFETEYLQCLYGTKTVEDSLVVADILLAVNADLRPSRSAVNMMVGAYPDTPANYCPWKFTTWELLGFAHPHLPDLDEPDEELCFLGPGDYMTMLREGFLLSVVVCGQDRFMLFSRFTGYIGLLCIFDAEADYIQCKDGEQPKSPPL